MFVSFFVMKIEYKRFGASDFKYEVREKRSYCTRECMKNINFKTIKACPNGKCFTVKHAKTLLVGKTFFRLATSFCAV